MIPPSRHRLAFARCGILLALVSCARSGVDGGAGAGGSGGSGGSAAAGGTTATAGAGARAGSPGAPNILILVWDTVRADRLSLYGHDTPTTPRLDAFAATATVYENALSPAMWTLPAHASLFTGLAPKTHGVSSKHKWLDDRFETLAERLAAAGYETYAFSANPFVSREFHMLQGFTTVEHPFDPRWRETVTRHLQGKRIPADRSGTIPPGLASPRLASPGPVPPGSVPPGTSKEERSRFKECAPVVREAFLSWLDRRDAARPFFAFLNYMEAHIPRTPSREARRAILDERTRRVALRVRRDHLLLLAHTLGKYRYGDEEVAAIRSIYDASLFDLDRETGRLLDALASRGVLEDTAIVFTADHGENLGEHGMFGHKFCIYDTLLHVPLVVRYPRRFEARRVTEPVSTIDCFATALDLAGLEREAAAPESVSLLDPRRGTPPVPAPVFSQMIAATPRALKRVQDAFGPFDWTPWLRTYDAVRLGRHKLIRDSQGGVMLFDVVEDPGEMRDIAGADPATAARLEAVLDDWLDAQPAYDPEDAGEEAKRGKLPEDLLEELRALGYAGGGNSR